MPLLEDNIINQDYIFSNSETGEAYIDLKNSRSEKEKGNYTESDDKEKIYLELLPILNVENSDDVILDKSKIQKDENGEYVNVLGYGPFNFAGRQLILRRLLEVQKLINTEFEDIDLINTEELEVIDKIWDEEEDLTRRTLVDLYHEVMGKRLPWDEYKKPMFDEDTRNAIEVLCTTHNIDQDLINKLLIETNKYKHFTNKSVLDKSINKILNARHLHKEIVEEIENDN